MSELREAVERLRESVDAQIPWEHQVYERESPPFDGRSPKSKFDCDCFKVVKAYLALTDPTPIDEAWLREKGWRYGISGYVLGGLRLTKCVENKAFTLWKDAGGGTWFKVKTGITARGDLAGLLAALGQTDDEN